MRFSPYRNPTHIGLNDTDENEDGVYDSDDSEELEFPVNPAANDDLWSVYEKATQDAVEQAVTNKSYQVDRLDHVIDCWSSAYLTKAASESYKDINQVQGLLKSLELQHEEEDRAHLDEFQMRNEDLLRRIESSIQVAVTEEEELNRSRREEEARLQHLEAERKRKEESSRLERERAALAREQQRQREAAEEARLTKVEIETKDAERRQAQAAEQAERLQMEQEEVLKAGGEAGLEARAWADRLERFKLDVLKPVSENQQTKNFCFASKRRITPKVGQVTNSMEHIRRIVGDLKMVFDAAMTEGGGEIAQKWCLNFFSKAIVKQAETEVTVKPTSAYPLAFLAISLMKQYPALRDIYIMRIVKKCPWTVPYLAYDKNTESGRTSLGWKRRQEGKYEEVTSYIERQSGMFTLWSATTSLKLKASPYGIEHGWKFIARLLNARIEDPDLRNTAYAIVASFLDVCGKSFGNMYKGQAVKMIKAIAIWVGPDSKGANAHRLRITVEQYFRTGTLGIEFDFEE